MKNYTLDKNTSFILGYKIKNGKIHVKYANKPKKSVHEYNESIESDILAKMEYQVKAENLKGNLFKRTKRNEWILRIYTYLSAALYVYSIVKLPAEIAAVICLGVSFSALPVLFLVYLLPKKYNDLKKNIIFLENKEEINESVKEDSYTLTNSLLKSNRKTSRIIEERKNEKEPFNINVIDDLSLKQLEAIRDAIKADKSFTEQSNSEKKGIEIIKK